jgi:hypothetical protein
LRSSRIRPAGWQCGAPVQEWRPKPFAEQGPHAGTFLLIFKKIVEHHAIVAAFRSHYKLVKETTDVPPALRRKPEDLL